MAHLLAAGAAAAATHAITSAMPLSSNAFARVSGLKERTHASTAAHCFHCPDFHGSLYNLPPKQCMGGKGAPANPAWVGNGRMVVVMWRLKQSAPTMPRCKYPGRVQVFQGILSARMCLPSSLGLCHAPSCAWLPDASAAMLIQHEPTLFILRIIGTGCLGSTCDRKSSKLRRIRKLSDGWIAPVFIRNLVLMPLRMQENWTNSSLQVSLDFTAIPGHLGKPSQVKKTSLSLHIFGRCQSVLPSPLVSDTSQHMCTHARACDHP